MSGLTTALPLVSPTIGGTLTERQRPGETRPVAGRSGVGASTLTSPNEERRLLERLRSGEEAAFVVLLERHGPSLRRLARTYASESVADDVVQETWIAVLHGLDGFEGRASLRTWIIRILMNVARGRAERERRHVPFSAFASPTGEAEPSVDPGRFRPIEGVWPGHWISYPRRWDEQPEEQFLSSEGVGGALAAIEALPPAQRAVVSLRDVEGWSSDEVSEALAISQGNQRVLLHRGRSKVRAALELAMAGPDGPGASMSPRLGDAMHPNLERYYDRATDRDGVDAHLRICAECGTWLADIHERLRDLRCIELVELVTEYLDDAVDSELRARIDDHLSLCEGCRNYLDEMRSTVAALGRVGGAPEPSEPVQAALLAAFRGWRRSRSQDPGHEE